ncbi:hypothetical protein HY251_09095 [bacterium]|nr:hypothetical protein [bacterium]
MGRGARLALACFALAATFLGAWLGRVSVSNGLYATFDKVCHMHGPSIEPEKLTKPLEVVAFTERMGEGILGVAILGWVVVAAFAARATPTVTKSAAILAGLAVCLGVYAPGSRLPGVLAVRPPSSSGLDDVVNVDRSLQNVFVVEATRNRQRCWAATVKSETPERASLDPAALADVLTERFAKYEKKNVRIYFPGHCDKESKAAFVAAVVSATSAVGQTFDEARLPVQEDWDALRKLNHQERLRPFQEGAYASTAARFCGALALALVVLWADARGTRARAASVLTAGCLVLALAQVVSLPLVLYLGILSERTAPDKIRYLDAVTPHVFLLVLGAIGLAAGAVIAMFGVLLMPEGEEPALPKLPRAPRVSLAPRPEATPASPSAPPSPAAPPSAAPPAPASSAAPPETSQPAPPTAGPETKAS